MSNDPSFSVSIAALLFLLVVSMNAVYEDCTAAPRPAAPAVAVAPAPAPACKPCPEVPGLVGLTEQTDIFSRRCGFSRKALLGSIERLLISTGERSTDLSAIMNVLRLTGQEAELQYNLMHPNRVCYDVGAPSPKGEK